MKTLSFKRNSSSLIETHKNNHFKTDNNFQELFHFLEQQKSNDHDIPLLSIILPVYNEEKSILKLIQSLPVHKSIEIIIVDDSSMDNSLKEIKKANYKGKIHIIDHKSNLGYGAALLTGIRHSKGKIFITMDSDGQHQASDLSNLVKPIFDRKADITIGSRYKGTYSYKLPLSTRIGEAVLEVVIRLFFGQKVKNNQGGFRAFHRKTVKMFEDTRFHGYAFTTELILSAVLHNYRIKECPIALMGREHGASYIILNKLFISLMLCVGLYILKNTKRLLSRK
ncbi:MAG: glycosyltransferase family 2 protein [Promethearchaeota archaeon]